LPRSKAYPLCERWNGNFEQIAAAVNLVVVRTWTVSGWSRLWSVQEADVLREVQGTGVIGRTVREEGRFREVGMLFEDSGTLLSRAIRSALSNNEFLLVELGGWDAPFEPYCLFIVTNDDNGGLVSMIETVPDPHGSRRWAPYIVEGRQTQNVSAPASPETIDVAPIMMMDAIATWGLEPWDLALTFGRR